MGDKVTGKSVNFRGEDWLEIWREMSEQIMKEGEGIGNADRVFYNPQGLKILTPFREALDHWHDDRANESPHIEAAGGEVHGENAIICVEDALVFHYDVLRSGKYTLARLFILWNGRAVPLRPKHVCAITGVLGMNRHRLCSQKAFSRQVIG